MTVLSICMPTVDRPKLFERALSSVVRTPAVFAVDCEIVVSDGSSDDATEEAVERLRADWAGSLRYMRHQPRLGMAENFNSTLSPASGEWRLVLHDDDHLLAGAVPTVLDHVRTAPPEDRALLYSVNIIDGGGQILRRQGFKDDHRLGPTAALERLLSNSSFVRFPALVLHHSVFNEIGMFDPEVGGPADTDLWIRVFARYGVRCLPETIAAYMVHPAALTEKTWNPSTIDTLLTLFDRAVRLEVVDEPVIRRWQSDFFHQFILAGAYRHLRRGDRRGAREILRLFQLDAVRELGLSRRWLPVRLGMSIVGTPTASTAAQWPRSYSTTRPHPDEDNMRYESLMPNLFLAGVAKAGTSSLFWYLMQHPEVCPPVDRKEIDFFKPLLYGKPIRGTREDYGRYFSHQSGERYRLDASPHYFPGGSPLVEAVHDHVPNARILIILRDPVARLWSSFRNKKETGLLKREITFRQYFDRCLEVRRSGKERLEEVNNYTAVLHGRYYEHLAAWFAAFGEDVRILFFEHLVRDPRAVMASTFSWLSLDSTPVDHFDYAARNKTVDPRSVLFSKFARAINMRIDPFLRRYPAAKEVARAGYGAINARRRGEQLSESDRRLAQEFYAPANEQLREDLVSRGYRDLPEWLTSSTARDEARQVPGAPGTAT